jgi:hypothetical protein
VKPACLVQKLLQVEARWMFREFVVGFEEVQGRLNGWDVACGQWVVT